MNIARKIVTVLVAVMIGVFIQSSLLGAFLPKMLVPNFVLIVGVFLAFFESTVFGAFLAFLAGLTFDLYSGILLGPWAGSLAVVFGMLTLLSRRMFVDSPFTAFASVFISALAGNIVYLLLLTRFSPLGGDVFSLALIVNSFMTALVAPPCFSLLRRVYVRRSHSLSGRFAAAYL